MTYALAPDLIFLVCANADRGACGVRNVLDEVLLAPAGGLDGRRLLDSLGAAAGKEEDAAEHRAEDTHGELLTRSMSAIILYLLVPISHRLSMRNTVRYPDSSSSS